jgi:drug/metabolite transporter (DMT)-like permease
VPLSAFLLALAAAFVHALWNLLIARARDPEAATAVVVVVAVVAFAPVAALTWEVEQAAWPYIAASSVSHLVYFSLLAAAYRRAELSLVYPLARGLAPVLVLVVAVAALGASTSGAEAVGICLVGAGVLLVRGLGGEVDTTGVAFGLAIALVIATYTLVDNAGIEHANPIAYLEASLLAPALVYSAAIVATKGFGAVRAEFGVSTIVAGIASFTAYALVLAALELAPAAPVAAVRETSVVIAVVGASLFLGERVGPGRFAGAALVAVGVALLGF